MTDLNTLMTRNQRFADEFTFADLAMKPRFSTLILTCLDSRIDPAHFLGLELGDGVRLAAGCAGDGGGRRPALGRRGHLLPRRRQWSDAR